MAHALSSPLVLFILQVVTVIVAARVVGVLTRRIGQPMVIAEVVAGILLGPSLLGWLAPGVSRVLFPATSLGLLGSVSQIGLILFMFIVGLELDPGLLKKRVHSSVLISHTSIIVPFALGAVLGLRLHATLAPANTSMASFLLFMGAAMSVTAFPVLARILVERRLMRSRVGAITIACAAVDDVTAWCILAFVVSIVRSTGLQSAIITTALALGYLAVMLFVARPLLARLAERTKLGLSQDIVAVVLIGLFLSSFVTELIGIHALFGAFLFGTIIPKQGSFVSALAEKIEDLVVVFLLPLFFAYSGLRTQIGLLSTPESWLTCAAITGIACLGKFGGSAVAARITGLPWRESSAIGILMNTRGLMELVVLNMGLDLGVISPKLFAMLVIMALVTTFMTTPLLQWIFPAEELAKELAEHSDSSLPDVAAAARSRYTALVCVAYERSGPGLVTLAAALTKSQAQKGRIYTLHLVRAADRASFVLDQQREKQTSMTDEAALAPLLERARDASVQLRHLSFVTMDPPRDICDVASVKRADVVLMGWHKPVLGTTMLSGTVHDVMRSARATVGVLVDRGLVDIRRVLVPYLRREHDRAALELARRIASNCGAKLTVLRVSSKDSERPPSATSASSASSDPAEETKIVAEANPIDAVIEESAAGYDLVVIGIGTQWGLEHRSFGIRTEKVLANAPVSVLVVRAAEHAVVTESATEMRSAVLAESGE
jgi:Kef-type K+ transport system membrane component KefB/nucleotide-binding universal stress UspA family protein